MLKIFEVGITQGFPLALALTAAFVLWRHYRKKDEKLEDLYRRYIEHLIGDLNELKGMLRGRESEK